MSTATLTYNQPITSRPQPVSVPKPAPNIYEQRITPIVQEFLEQNPLIAEALSGRNVLTWLVRTCQHLMPLSEFKVASVEHLRHVTKGALTMRAFQTLWEDMDDEERQFYNETTEVS